MTRPDLVALTRWNVANQRAIDDYHRRPIRSCRVGGCDFLADYDHRYCRGHRGGK